MIRPAADVDRPGQGDNHGRAPPPIRHVPLARSSPHRRGLILALTPVVAFTSVAPDATGAKVAAVALVIVQAATLLGCRPPRARDVRRDRVRRRARAALPVARVPGFANIPLSAFSWVRPPRVSLWGLGAMLVLVPLDAVTGGDAASVLIAAGGAVLAWTWGELWRTRRGRRRDAARRAVSGERARIARELHDVVAHNVSIIVVQAVAAEDVFDQRPDVARQALRTIEATGRDALAELRRLLQTMRPDEPEGEDGHAPQPGLDHLDVCSSFHIYHVWIDAAIARRQSGFYTNNSGCFSIIFPGRSRRYDAACASDQSLHVAARRYVALHDYQFSPDESSNLQIRLTRVKETPALPENVSSIYRRKRFGCLGRSVN